MDYIFSLTNFNNLFLFCDMMLRMQYVYFL